MVTWASVISIETCNVRADEGSAREIYRFVQAAVVYTYRSIVHQPDVHHGLEHAVLDPVLCIHRLDLGEELVVELFSLSGARRLVEVGFISFLGGSEQGELRDYRKGRDEYAAVGCRRWYKCMGTDVVINQYSPQRTSPSISWTLRFHLPPSSASHNLTFRILPAIDSTSFWVSSLATAARTNRPLPMVDTSWPSTVTEADFTRCMTAGDLSIVVCIF